MSVRTLLPTTTEGKSSEKHAIGREAASDGLPLT